MTQQRTNQRICPQCGEDYGEDVEFCPDDGTRLRAFSIRTGDDEEDALLGAEIDGRFQVERVLGEGGMGKVYAGKQLSVNREVAIKVLRAELASDEKIVKRFFREAQVISQFSHPNIVSLVDFGQDVERDVLYLAMEFIDGTELSDLVVSHRLAPALALDIMIQTCEALSEPHELGVVHRDLKPENLMLLPRSDGRVQAKVVDFGIAHAIQHQTKLTQTGSVFGTAHYMAPEQAQGDEVAAHTDVYALGCILFELLAGSVPFDGDTAMQLLMAHVQGEPPVLSHYLEGGDDIDALSEIILRMMSKDAAQRPNGVLAVRDELEHIQRQFSYPRVRVDTSQSSTDMFRPWLMEPVDMEAPVGGGMARGTNAPMSAHQTDENMQQALGDTFASTDQFADTMAPPSEQGGSGTAEVAAHHQGGTASQGAVQPAQQGTQTRTGTGHMTDMTDMAVASTQDRYKKPAIAVTVVALLVAGLALALVFSSGDESPTEESMAGVDGELAPTAVDESSVEEEESGVREQPPDEQGVEEEELAPEAHDDAEEDAAPPLEAIADGDEEPEPEPEPAPRAEPEPEPQPEPQPDPRPDPRPSAQPEPEPQPTPRAEPEPQQEEEEETGRRQLDIFTVD